MKKTLVTRLFSLLLVMTLLVQMLPAQAFATEVEQSTTIPSALHEQTESALAEKQTQIVEELTDKRTASSKQYLLRNGLTLAVLYAEPVHYREDGQWCEIDNTLVRSAAGYQNTAGQWEVSLPGNLSAEDAVSVTKDGYTLRFQLAGEIRLSGSRTTGNTENDMQIQPAQSSAGEVEKIDLSVAKESAAYPALISEKNHSRICYESVYPATDIIYDLKGNALKESIVINSYDHSLRGYRYTLNTGKLTPVLKEDGSVDLFAPSQKEPLLHMPAPYLLDACGAISEDVKVELVGGNGAYALVYLPDTQWLADKSRQWPIVLDPVIEVTSVAQTIEDVAVYETGREANHLNGILDVGKSTSNGIARSFLKYKDASLPVLTSSDMIVQATLSLYKNEQTSPEEIVEVHKVISAWESETLSWTSQPGIDPSVEDFMKVSASGFYSTDITDIVRCWYRDGNTGLALTATQSVENGSGTNGYRSSFWASDYSNYVAPSVCILIRNNNGLESYWDYTGSSAGRAGTGYVNLYTGNLVWVHEDMGFGGNRMPVSIRHIYNANDAAVNYYGLGFGWRTNYHQKVYQWSINSNYYVWEDSDGTRHYFLWDPQTNTYKDEDGLELTLTAKTSTYGAYEISDKLGNISYFDANGRLVRMQNNQQTPSAITITYEGNSGRIQNITDGVGRRYEFIYTYDLLTRIRYCGTGTLELFYTAYTYNTSSLIGITYADGKSTSFTYAGLKLLTSAQDIDGYKLTYTYNTTALGWQPCRVESITESYNGKIAGQLALQYSQNQTILTDANSRQQILHFNNWGNTLSVQDDQGHAQYARYSSGEGSKSNQLMLSSKPQNTVGNALRDNSFENGSHMWTAGNSNATLSLATNEHYYGSRSLKLTAGTSGRAFATSGVLTIPANTYCTFSAYVKTGAGSVWFTIDNGETTVSSATHFGTTWTRLEVTYRASYTKNIQVQIWTDAGGAAYMDCAQLEFSASASRFNLVDNGDFRFWDGDWSVDNRVVLPASPAPMLESGAYPMEGTYSTVKQISQTVEVSGSKGDSYVLSGWATGDAVPLYDSRKFGLILTFNNTDGTKTTQQLHFSPDIPKDLWQYASIAAVAEKAYSSISVTMAYDYGANKVYFDGIQLFKETFGASYTYDSEGNVISATDLQGKVTTYEYQNNDLTKEILPDGEALSYTYDAYHNVKTATTQEQQLYSFTYDPYGNNTQVKITKENLTMVSTAVYTEDGNRLYSVTDSLNRTTRYGYDADTNELEWVQYPADTQDSRTQYDYDTMFRAAEISLALDSATALSVSYGYSNDLLSTITTGSTAYSFTYGDFALPSAVKVGNRTLASYSYTDDHNLYLQELQYGNGDSVGYSYDSWGRVAKETYETGNAVFYAYNNDGELAIVTDSAISRTAKYYYDFIGRMAKLEEVGSGYRHEVSYTYDARNNLSAVEESIDGQRRTTDYSYNRSNRVVSVNANGVLRSYSYDGLGRLEKQAIGSVLTESYAYSAAGANTSSQVARLDIAAPGLSRSYSYTYDNNGNILSVSDGNTTTTYAYDKANQLIRENNQAGGFTYVWTYDRAGNILSRTMYAYTTGTLGAALATVNYTYGDSQWGDLLTGYGNRTITSDAIGNTLSDGKRSYTWEHGRQLATLTMGGTTWGVDYDTAGMRCVRTNGPIRYEYVYNGSRLSQMKKGSEMLLFSYDAGGWPMTLTHNGTLYYYVLNLQGDVVALLNSSGTPVVQYTYDAWGNLLSCTGSLASTLGILNPLRYRGYVYDAETGLYYLQSRYYDPEIGRFINADAFVSTGQGFVGYNMFAYCINNPTNYYDPNGASAFLPTTVNQNDGASSLFGGRLGTYGSGNIGVVIPIFWGFPFSDDNSSSWIFSKEDNKSTPGKSDSPTQTDGKGTVDKKNPPTEKDGYKAPKGGPKRGKTKDGKIGWVDKYGNVWVPAPTSSPLAHGGGHWDVVSPSGNGYVNVYPGGITRYGGGKPPTLPLLK